MKDTLDITFIILFTIAVMSVIANRLRIGLIAAFVRWFDGVVVGSSKDS